MTDLDKKSITPTHLPDSDVTGATPKRLLDDDGENLAVRAFLMAYRTSSELTIWGMKRHMELSGYPHWPDWVEGVHRGCHLNKGGAQLWLRYLFDLEARPTQLSQLRC